MGAVGVGAAALKMGFPASANAQVSKKESKKSRAMAKAMLPRTQAQVIAVDNGAQALIEAATALGLNYWLINPGTDWPALIDGFAKKQLAGSTFPQIMSVPHENAATEMAGGYAAISGTPAILGYHVIVGPSNSEAHLANLFTMQIPAIIIGGKRSWTETGNLLSDQGPQGQESYDQGGLIRQYVKYDYELKTIDQIPGVLARAVQIAMTEPKGPVYLMLPCELGADSSAGNTIPGSITIQPQELFTPSAPAAPDPESVTQAAQLLANAQNPVILTGGSTTGPGVGKNPLAVPPLVMLANELAIPVSSALGSYLNFPTDNPMSGTIPLSQADVIVNIDASGPWSTKSLGIVPNAKATYITIGSDPLFVDPYPFSSFYPADVRITARTDLALTAILEQATEIVGMNSALQSTISNRRATITASYNKSMQAAIASAQSYASTTPINASWVGYCMGQVIDANTIVVNEIGPSSSTWTINQPGSYLGTAPSSTLGQWGGMSLGAKLAAPNKTVICGVGDGAYMYGVPCAVFFAAARYKLPFLTVIDNNTCWGAVKSALTGAYPKGYAVTNGLSDLGSDLSLSTTSRVAPSYEMVCQAFGGYGEKVTDPAQVAPALQRGLAAVKNGQAAVLNMITQHPGP